MFCENISEISFWGMHMAPIKVGGFMCGEEIKELVPIFNPEGALLAARVIGTAGQPLSLIPIYGVVCNIKTTA